jgi:pyruvate/2-oxoglutarate dehydrogenase complex dihydrolipoamide dehydrogenase (E3) component
MSDPERYNAIVIGDGKGGKTPAKIALTERDSMMIGGTWISVACIPTKTFIASAGEWRSRRVMQIEGEQTCLPKN